MARLAAMPRMSGALGLPAGSADAVFSGTMATTSGAGAALTMGTMGAGAGAAAGASVTSAVIAAAEAAAAALASAMGAGVEAGAASAVAGAVEALASAFSQSRLSRMSQPGLSFLRRQPQRPTRNMQASSSEASSRMESGQAPSTRPRPNTAPAKLVVAGSKAAWGPAIMRSSRASAGSSRRRRRVANFSRRGGPGPSWLSGSLGSWMGSEATCSRNLSRFSTRSASAVSSGEPLSAMTQMTESPARSCCTIFWRAGESSTAARLAASSLPDHTCFSPSPRE